MRDSASSLFSNPLNRERASALPQTRGPDASGLPFIPDYARHSTKGIFKNSGLTVQNIVLRLPKAAEGRQMRSRYLLAIMLIATAAQAREPRHYQSGKL